MLGVGTVNGGLPSRVWQAGRARQVWRVERPRFTDAR